MRRDPRLIIGAILVIRIGACLVLPAIVGTAAKAAETTLIFEVGPERKDCVGAGPMKCLVVNGELFYNEIEGFSHQRGTSYVLKVARSEAFPDGNIPADASAWRYRLVKVISKK